MSATPPDQPTQSVNYHRALTAARHLLETMASPTAADIAERAGMSLSTYHRAVPVHADLLSAAGKAAEPSTREQILATASELIGRVGFAALTMEEIAGEAGVSRSTLYRLFPSKDDVLIGLVDSQAALASLGPALEQSRDIRAEQVLPFLVAAAAPRLVANRHLLRAVLAHPIAGDGQEISGRGPLKQMFAAIGTYLAHQMDLGNLRRIDPTAATIALLGPLYTYVVTQPDLWSEGATPPDLDEMVTTSVQLWLRGMQP